MKSGNDGRTRMKPSPMKYCILLGAALCAPLPAAYPAPPPLALANDYEDAEIDLPRYWISEKYDGVRAYWQDYGGRSGRLLVYPPGGELRVDVHFEGLAVNAKEAAVAIARTALPRLR